MPTWRHQSRETYRLDVRRKSGLITSQQQVTVSYEHVGTRWIVTQQTFDTAANLLSSSVTGYDDTVFAPQYTETVTRLSMEETLMERVSHSGTPGKYSVSLTYPGGTVWEDELPVTPFPLDVEDSWIFRFAHAPLSVGMRGGFARLDLEDPQAFVNWVRLVPVQITVEATNFEASPQTQIEAWVIRARDGERTLVAWIARDGSGLLQLETESEDIAMRMVRA